MVCRAPAAASTGKAGQRNRQHPFLIWNWQRKPAEPLRLSRTPDAGLARFRVAPGILSWTETQMRKVQRTVCSRRVQLRPGRGKPRVALRKDGRTASARIMRPTTGSSEFCGPVTRMADVMGRGERVQQAARATALLERLPAGTAIARSIIGQWGPQQAMDCAGCPQGVAGSAGAMAMIAINRLATNLTRHLMLIGHPL